MEDGFSDSIKYRKSQVDLPASPRGYPTDQLGTILNTLLRVERGLFAGKSLTYDSSVSVY